MAIHYFQVTNIVLEDLVKGIVMWFKEREYTVDSADAHGEYMIQAKKVGKIRTLLGTNSAFLIKLSTTEKDDELKFESSIGQWTANLAGAGITGVFTGGLTWLTGAAGAAWAVKIERDLIEDLQNKLHFKKIKTLESSEELHVKNEFGKLDEQNLYFNENSTSRQKAEQKIIEIKENIDKAYENGILSADERNKKIKEIDKKILDYEVEFMIAERLPILRKACSDGIISEKELNDKTSSMEEQIRLELETKYRRIIFEDKLKKFQSALENGILNESEYQAKVKELQSGGTHDYHENTY